MGAPLAAWAKGRGRGKKGKGGKQNRGPKHPGPGAGAAEYVGSVTVAEGARRVLTVQGKARNTSDGDPSGSRTFTVPSSCWIEDPGRDRPRIRLSDISPGTQVTVAFSKSMGGKYTAKSIKVGVSKTGAEKSKNQQNKKKKK